MTTSTIILVISVISSHQLLTAASHTENHYTSSGPSGNIVLDNVGSANQIRGVPGINVRQDTGTFGTGASINTGALSGTPGSIGGATFAQANVARPGNIVGGTDSSFGPGAAGVGAAGVRFGQAGLDRGTFGFGQAGLDRGTFGFGQAGVGVGGAGFNAGGRGGGVSGGGFGSGQGATRVIEAPATPTVTKTVTIDHFVTLTDLAFHSVPVTLTDLVVRTTTLTTGQVIRTPVDDRMALQTTVVIRPTSMTVTCSKYYYNVVTDVSVDHYTITHTSYIIDQVTYTTTATQVSTYASTMVRTIVHTKRTTVTDYHTITNTVHGQGGGYYY